jgi:hypothetical protein
METIQLNVFHIAKDDNNDLRVKTEKREEKRRREENRGEERQHKHTDMSTREILRCEKRTYFTLS